MGNLALLSGLGLGNAGAVAMGVAFLVVPAIVYLRLRRAIAGLDLSQESPEAAFEGDRIRVGITLQNRGSSTVAHPRFSEVFSAEDEAQKDLVFRARIAPEESADEYYTGLCLGPRGRFDFGPTVLRLSDVFGWFEIQTALGNDRLITIYPRLDDFGLLDAMSTATAVSQGELVRGGPGDSSEFWSVRDYRSGDSRRRIHWSATARRGQLVVREFGRPASGDTAVLIDRNRRVPGAQRRYGAFENVLRLAAGIVDHALKHGRMVQLIDEDGRLGPAPGTPGARLVNWLEPLVDLAPTSDETLAAVIQSRRAEIAQSAVLIVPVHAYAYGDETLASTLADLARQGRRVVAVMIDEDREADAEARRVARYRLRRKGVEVHALGQSRHPSSERQELVG
jgi:uncharacterized protein (DUF58 family)